jgi:large subunit ribosomal protein L28
LDRTRREWKPNAQYKALFSDVLGESVRLRVTTHALRCIDKAGGLDAYLLNTRKEKLDSQVGVKLKRYLQVVKSAQEPEAVTPGQAPQA